MAENTNLRELRQRANLTMRELARLVGVDHSNIRYWEQSGKIPRSDLLVPIAKALGVTIQELLGQPKPKQANQPGGRLGVVCQEISGLPRNQQARILDTIETLLAGQKVKTS